MTDYDAFAGFRMTGHNVILTGGAGSGIHHSPRLPRGVFGVLQVALGVEMIASGLSLPGRP